jgi:hypothetical protein
MRFFKLVTRVAVLLVLATSLSSCDPQVYGSVGMSSWGGGGYNSGPRMGGSISIGGCLTCR